MIQLNPKTCTEEWTERVERAKARATELDAPLKIITGREVRIISPNSGEVYTVQFFGPKGNVSAQCTCTAASANKPCWHVYAAVTALERYAKALKGEHDCPIHGPFKCEPGCREIDLRYHCPQCIQDVRREAEEELKATGWTI